MLACPVRGCNKALLKEPRRFICENHHSFDIARSGYANLLQPQDRRSKNPGDSEAAVAARRRLYDRGFATPLADAIADLAQPAAHDIALDAGCGEGFYLGTLQRRCHFTAHGLDISIPAINAAARRYPDCQWFVANADRALPYADNSFSLVLSITGRMNVPEFHRVLLKPEGRLLVAVPGPRDLVELRKGEERDRVERTRYDFEQDGRFQFVEHRRATTTVELDREAVADVRHAIYRPLGNQDPRELTFALDLLLFRKLC